MITASGGAQTGSPTSPNFLDPVFSKSAHSRVKPLGRQAGRIRNEYKVKLK
jgi:hypothetical protein